ncbi:flagellar basal body protein [Scenedesmus sp. NREL 46B-D3]|nr:flagellar basal body protein [Scenedesmus sp. NREL 46B-D3]
MVLLHLKNSEEDQFLFNTSVQASVQDAAAELAKIHNLRHRITRLKLEGEELAKFGPAKQPDQQGIDQYSEQPVQQGPFYNMDPTGRRSGNACDPLVAQKLTQELEQAAAAASKALVQQKQPLTAAALEAAVDNIRGAVMICYPEGLPAWDFVRQCLEGREDLAGTNFGGVDLDPASCTLWFAGKQLLPDKLLSEYVGRNERTRAVVKLQKKGQGPPAREPAVDADTQKAMMAWYYKKQEEQKALSQDEEDAYTHSSWANSKSLKQAFAGINSVRFPR